jgi:uncharacterized protein (TIGR00255 family)
VIQSMTAYASRAGRHGSQTWTWEMRGVNARGLDLRLRLPEGVEGLEPQVRAALGARLSRGNVSLSLRLSREPGGGALTLDPDQLDRVLGALQTVQERARALGVTLAPPTAADVLGMRGVVIEPAPDEADSAGFHRILLADLEGLIDDFVAMRRAEGQALEQVLATQLDGIVALTDAAAAAAEARREEMRAQLRQALRRVFEEVPEMDEGRVAQELALLAVKSDVTEEIARLRAHAAAARDLLADARPAGRRLDFLAQEFNREANTLCAKALSSDLTRVGLELKALIDQMREQIQNVE